MEGLRQNPTVLIRRARAEDLEGVLDLGGRMVEEGWFKETGLLFNRDKIAERGAVAAANDHGLLLVAENEEGIVFGFLFASLGEYDMFDDFFSATSLTYIVPEMRGRGGAFQKLFAAWETWSAAWDAHAMFFAPGLTGGPHDFDFLLKMGWVRSGVAYRKQLRKGRRPDA